ncbi:hypothetical protein VTL71DRAFT_8117 [Oculimacula yallundae]|uniref:BTB domain-containing protein n=1 Tax=Oculimacula yallundae TaxID=86028 RepID=A0ABR4CWP2_9HELO
MLDIIMNERDQIIFLVKAKLFDPSREPDFVGFTESMIHQRKVAGNAAKLWSFVRNFVSKVNEHLPRPLASSRDLLTDEQLAPATQRCSLFAAGGAYVSTKPPTFSDRLTMVTIDFSSGFQQSQFLVYKEFACYHSPVIRAAIQGSTNVGHAKIGFKRELGSTMMFGSVLEWMYTGQLGKDVKVSLELSCDLWFLAEKLSMAPLQNYIAEQILKHGTSTNMFDFDRVHARLATIYDDTLPKSPLRRLIVDLCAFETEDITWFLDSDEGNIQEEIPKDFIFDVLVALKRDRQATLAIALDGSPFIRKQLNIKDYLIHEPSRSA